MWMRVEVTNYLSLIGNLKQSQIWLNGKITSLQQYLKRPMSFQDSRQQDLHETLSSRANVLKAIRTTENTLQGLQQFQYLEFASEEVPVDWLIAALKVQLQGYLNHLQALDQLSEAWTDQDILKVYLVVDMIIEALKQIAHGQSQIIQGLELIRREPDSCLMN